MARGLKPRVEPAIEAALQKKGNLSDLDLAKLCFCARDGVWHDSIFSLTP